MSATGVSVFDSTVQTTNIWLDDLMQVLDWSDRHRAYAALRSVLHALRDRLPTDEVAQFAAQLPMLVRGFFYEGWHPSGKPLNERTKEEFVAHVVRDFNRVENTDSERIVRAVFDVIARHVTPGEAKALKHCLPAEIREMWA